MTMVDNEESREVGITIAFVDDDHFAPEVRAALKNCSDINLQDACLDLNLFEGRSEDLFVIDVGPGYRGLLKESGIREKPHSNPKSPLFNGYSHKPESRR